MMIMLQYIAIGEKGSEFTATEFNDTQLEL